MSIFFSAAYQCKDNFIAHPSKKNYNLWCSNENRKALESCRNRCASKIVSELSWDLLCANLITGLHQNVDMTIFFSESIVNHRDLLGNKKHVTDRDDYKIVRTIGSYNNDRRVQKTTYGELRKIITELILSYTYIRGYQSNENIRALRLKNQKE